MRVGEPGKLQSAINVTPLVDVVLVLLIVFMVVAPRLEAGPALSLPETERPADRPEDGPRIQVGIERDGSLWIDDEEVPAERFARRLQEISESRGEEPVLIQGDAGLSFGEVRRAMLAVEAAGFGGVALIAERVTAPGAGE